MKENSVTLYKDYKWFFEEPDELEILDLRRCPHCKGSAMLKGRGNEWQSLCQNYNDGKECLPECATNFYFSTYIILVINAWNKYDHYSKCKQSELSYV